MHMQLYKLFQRAQSRKSYIWYAVATCQLPLHKWPIFPEWRPSPYQYLEDGAANTLECATRASHISLSLPPRLPSLSVKLRLLRCSVKLCKFCFSLFCTGSLNKACTFLKCPAIVLPRGRGLSPSAYLPFSKRLEKIHVTTYNLYWWTLYLFHVCCRFTEPNGTPSKPCYTASVAAWIPKGITEIGTIAAVTVPLNNL